MRRRLINSTLAVVLVVIAVFGISLVIVESRTIESSAKESVQSDAVQLIGVVENRIAAGEKVSPPALTRQITSQRYAVIRIPGQGPITLGTPPEGKVIQSLQTGVHGESVLVQESRSVISQEIGRTLLVILAVALLAIAAAVVLAVQQARRLTSPLIDLAETAERLGSGDPRPRHRRYGVPELDRVADVLDASAERIAKMLTAERRLAADASHQLRTPLTALSMRLEEIIATDDHDTVKEEATIALGQVERLTDVVQRLLTNSRDPRTGSAVAFDLDEVIKQQLEEWRPAYRGEGRSISRSGTRGLRAVGTPGAVAQVLATLIENALMHGSGSVVIHTRVTGNQAVAEVTDEGQGVPPDLGSRVFERTVSGRNSTGLGLAVARDLAEADGGRLELLQQRPPVFALFLAREAVEGDVRRLAWESGEGAAGGAETPKGPEEGPPVR
ncbi:ATP-binding protein [Streptomyces sp. NPDC020096]